MFKLFFTGLYTIATKLSAFFPLSTLFYLSDVLGYFRINFEETVMEVKYRKSAESVTVYVSGELDECSFSATKDILDKLIYDNANSKKFIFDLSGVSFMDSTGIGLLIGRYKKLKHFNIPSYISGASVATEKVLQLAGIYTIMPKF